jgi:HSP20 family molecular chaperone IbpA
MFEEMDREIAEMQEYMHDRSASFASAASVGHVDYTLDITEKDDGVILSVSLPQAKADDIDVDVEDGILSASLPTERAQVTLDVSDDHATLVVEQTLQEETREDGKLQSYHAGTSRSMQTYSLPAKVDVTSDVTSAELQGDTLVLKLKKKTAKKIAVKKTESDAPQKPKADVSEQPDTAQNEVISNNFDIEELK